MQVVLQQGQVEVEAKDFIGDYEDALLIHRSVIEDLNSTIRVPRSPSFLFKKSQTTKCINELCI